MRWPGYWACRVRAGTPRTVASCGSPTRPTRLRRRHGRGKILTTLATLAETISTWCVEIANALLHGLSNAAAEGINRLATLVYRAAFALRNVTNQQRRARYTASRSTCPDRLPHVITHLRVV